MKSLFSSFLVGLVLAGSSIDVVSAVEAAAVVATERGRDVWMTKAPLEPKLWPDAGHPVNRDRL